MIRVEFSPVQKSYTEIKSKIDHVVLKHLEQGPYVGGNAL